MTDTLTAVTSELLDEIEAMPATSHCTSGGYLVSINKGKLAALVARIRELEAQRDAAFAMSKCECEAEECCRNLADANKKTADAEAESLEQARLLGMGAERELRLMARIRELEAENAELKHDIAAYVEANSDLLEECDAALDDGPSGKGFEWRGTPVPEDEVRAKAAAQADYEARILSALVAAPEPPSSVSESPNSSNSQGSLDGSSEHNNPIGWIFFNPDAGVEFSENHPIESGEVPDAENVREATSETLLEELLSAWKDWEADRQILDEYKSAAADPVKAQLVEALTRQGNNMSFILNHMTIPDQYYEKFTRELSEDRAALAAAEAEENRNKG